MKCVKCGQELPQNAMFCDNCGNKIGAPKPEAPDQTVPQTPQQEAPKPETPVQTVSQTPQQQATVQQGVPKQTSQQAKAQTSAPPKSFCSNCGAPKEEGAFCGNCGASPDGTVRKPAAKHAVAKKAAPPKKKKSTASTVILIVILIIALAGAGVGGYFVYRYYEENIAIETSTDDEDIEEDEDEEKNEEEDKKSKSKKNSKDKDEDERKSSKTKSTPSPSPSPSPSPTPMPTMAPPEMAYLFPSDSVYITDADLFGKTKDEVALIRNEIYARHGYVFQTEPFKTYFAAKTWYYPNPYFSEALFNDVEKANKDFLVAYEQVRGWR